MKNTLLALISAVTLSGCFGQSIDETQLCTETRYGNVTTPIMDKGWAWLVIADATCFPATQQVYPGDTDDDGKPNAEIVSALTRDSVDLKVEFAFEHVIPREQYFDSVFKTKRSVDNFQLALVNGAREGARSAIGNARSGDAFNNREQFGDSLQAALQRSIGGLTHITRVYVRDMDLPAKVREAREAVFQQSLALDQALKQRRIDSVGNVTKIQNAETHFKVSEAQARVYKDNPELKDLEIKKAQAAALGNVCGRATTCIIGGSVMDTWRSVPTGGR